jgi:hypothetical protein
MNRVSAVRKKVDRVVSTSQGANLSMLVQGQKTCMFLDEMKPYPLGTGPPGTAEGTLALPKMFVSRMPFQVLGSLIRFVAIGTMVQACESLATILRVPCASRIGILSSFLKL